MGCLAKGLNLILTVIRGAFLAIFSLVVSIGGFWGRKVSTAFRENRPQHGAAWIVGGVGLLLTLCICPSLARSPNAEDTVARPTAITMSEEVTSPAATKPSVAVATDDTVNPAATATPSIAKATWEPSITPTTADASVLPPTWTPIATATPSELLPIETPVSGGSALGDLPPTWTPIATATPNDLPPTWTPIPPSPIGDPATPTEIAVPTVDPPTPAPPVAPPSGGNEGGTGNPSGFECSEDGCQQPPDPNCPIKGNISMSSGDRIYHIPGWQNYDSTLIDTTAGERWFCTEEEAVAAGWRKPKNV